MQNELDFDIVLTAYGLTEATGFGTMCRPDDDAVTVATTCGRPIADFELRIDRTLSEEARSNRTGTDGTGSPDGRGAATRPQCHAGISGRSGGHGRRDRRRRLAAHRRRGNR